jgi:small-conductance mechanosensitive channel
MSTETSPPTGLAALLRHGVLGVVLVCAGVAGVRLAAQEPVPRPQDPLLAVSSATPGEPAVLQFANRPITTLRATILSRSAGERAAAARERLERILHDHHGVPGAASSRPLEGASMISVGGRDVFAIFPLDVNDLAGETQESKVAEAVSNLQRALDETVELRTPRRMFWSALQVLLGTAVFGLLLLVSGRVRRALVVPLVRSTEKRLSKLAAGDEKILQAWHASDILRYTTTAGFVAVALFFTYAWLTFSLRRFPYTRPWGESLRAFLIDRFAFIGSQIVAGVPDLFTVLLIVLLTRFVVRVCHAVFQGVEEGRLTLPYVYPETAAPTRRLVSTLIWLLGLVLAYPYLPGSNSDAFKGVSVFVGLVLSLGSSGIVNQLMSGLTITYSRALRKGDFVKMGDVEGTVTHIGPLATKLHTPRGEEVTIPNAVVMSDVTTNYSRLAETQGVYVATSLTIGYDTPWRQVHALLILAAERTAGVRATPKPVVRQTALQDFYVHYTLMVSLENPSQRGSTLAALHANILDAFNEYGVQITSPNYEADPTERKVVPQEQWYAAPAKPPGAIEPLR